MVWATNSLPVPLSPVMVTVEVQEAARSIHWCNSWIGADVPTILGIEIPLHLLYKLAVV